MLAVLALLSLLPFSYSYMIDNVILLITGTLHQRSIAELVPKCHPLGSFEQMEAVNIAQTPAELYNAILVDTPLGKIRGQLSNGAQPWVKGKTGGLGKLGHWLESLWKALGPPPQSSDSCRPEQGS